MKKKNSLKLKYYLTIVGSFVLLFSTSCQERQHSKKRELNIDNTTKEIVITEKTYDSIRKLYSENRALYHIDTSVRFKDFENLKSLHHHYKAEIVTAVPFIDQKRGFVLDSDSLRGLRFNPHRKVIKIEWDYKGSHYTLDSIGNSYSIVNDQLLVINTKLNKLLFFSPKGEKIRTISAPNMKHEYMVKGKKYPDDHPYYAGKWVIRPAGIPIENNEGDIIDYKTGPGDLSNIDEKINIHGEEYIRVIILGSDYSYNMEMQLLTRFMH